MTVSQVGTIKIGNHLQLSNIFYVPNLSYNLLSVGQLIDQGFECLFSSNGCQVRDQLTKKVIGIGRKVGRLFHIDWLHASSHYSFSTAASLKLWHLRLGHVSSSYLNKLVSDGQLGFVSKTELNCLECKLGKFCALPFPTSNSTSHAPFDLIHSDIWGPSRVSTMGGSIYYIIFVDDYSRYT